MAVEIRNYKKSDAKEIAQIYYNTIHEINIRDYSKEQVDAWAPIETSKEEHWINRYKSREPIVAVIGENIVGFAEFDSNGYIDCFFVHSNYQGYGIGSVLMRYIENIARERNISRIYANVSITAKRFFEKYHFTVKKEQLVEFNGVTFKNFEMEKFYDK